MANYQINNSINWYSVVDRDSNKPVTPLYFVAYKADNTSFSVAVEICKALNEGLDMKQYEGYKYKSIK